MNQDGSGTMSGSQRVAPPVPPKKPKISGTTKDGEKLSKSFVCDSNLRLPREKLVACEDLTRLPVLYDDIVVGCVCERYRGREYYTWAGPTLVACNPCHPVPHLYTKDLIEHHHHQVKSGAEQRDSHVYSVSGVALHRLTHHLGNINQAILVSGESGAGKTESARYMLGYLTHTETEVSQLQRSPLKGIWANKQSKDIQDRILASNPILEAFGNAATLRNHNSSRFGKLLRLQYGGHQLRGAQIDTYLLEKTRITHQPQNERNFHIFYQVVAGVRAGVLTDLGIDKNQHFAILTRETTPSDLSNLYETLSAFKQLEFSQSHQQKIFQVLAALLHLGNVSFIQEGGNANWTINKGSKEYGQSVSGGSGLVGVSEERLAKTLTIHTISVSSAHKVSVFQKSLELKSQCLERRDALMQLLYHRLFLHIIYFINTKITAHRNIWSHFIGILDVYGFETFARNSLEQLCINYANERLQQAFILRYLSAEHQVLKEEGFLGVDIPYTDNSNCVAALDSHISVFTILNEECQLRRAVREREACERVCRALEDTGVVTAPVTPGHTPGFVIRHYAGPVKYDATGLLYKNKDEVPVELLGLLDESSCSFIKKLSKIAEPTDLEGNRRTTRKITTLSKFKSSLDMLMMTLSSCDLHYVRCIKPSARAVAGVVEEQYILQQLKACGVIETVSISQAGYPIRLTYSDFISRYGETSEASDAAIYSMVIAKSVLSSDNTEIDPKLCRFGHTRVFLSESALHNLENVRKEKRHNAATCLQKCWKRYRSWKQYKVLRAASCLIQKHVKTWVARRRYIKIRHASVVVQKNIKRFLAHKDYQRLYKATLTIQRYFRGWIARRKYEAMMQQTVMRPYSRQSVVSMNSLGYYSLTTSTSVYSLSPSIPDMSPYSGANSDVGSVALSGESLRAYLSPEHHKRLLETEESGIETDTESINGDASHKVKRSRKLRRRAQLQKLLGARAQIRINRVPSDESLVDVSHKPHTEDIMMKDEDVRNFKLERNENVSFTKCSNVKNSSDEKLKSVLIKPKDTYQKLRVATIRNLQEASSILKGYCPSENLEIDLPKQNLSLFFKDGVLSYRRMPVVGIKFHTRRTCLPFSHHLPHREQPQGLLDALH